MSIAKHIKEHKILKSEFRGAFITQYSIGNGSPAATTIRPSNGTYAYGALGAFTKIRLDHIEADTDSAANVTATTTTVTNITVGNPTVITLSSNPWGAVVGDLLYLANFAGADAAFINGQSFAISAINTLDFSLNVNTTGKTITDNTNTATAENGDYSSITVPSWANYVKVTGHLSYPDQNVAAGHARIHLWRHVRTGNLTTAGSHNQAYGASPGSTWVGVGDRPTPEAHYHNAAYYPQFATSDYISLMALTPWIPVLATNEVWTLYGWQSTGASVVSDDAAENWIEVQFRK